MSEYLKLTGVYVKNFIEDTKKSKNYLQPIFEAFTNSLESLKEIKNKDGNITISLFIQKPISSTKKELVRNIFHKIVIEDNGIGLAKEQFDRLVNFRDDTKNFNNRGTGRIQFLHSFKTTSIHSIYEDSSSSTGFKQRITTLSKIPNFLHHNAFIRLEDGDNIEAKSQQKITTVTFSEPYTQQDQEYFSTLTIEFLKQHIIDHYLPQFCENRDTLPIITIKLFDGDKLDSKLHIVKNDIPEIDKKEKIKVNYSDIKNGEIIKNDKYEEFVIKGFKLDKNLLKINEIKLVSKGEIASNLKMENLLPNDIIENNRYLFLVSGNYIDTKDSDNRGNLNIKTKKEFEYLDVIFPPESEILLEDIEKETNKKITQLYKEIDNKSKEKFDNLKKLQEMFLLNPETIEQIKNKITINDTDESILTKIYQADSKISANKDAEITKQIKELDLLDPSIKNEYQKKLQNKVNELVKTIPLQNRTELTQYVARRKLVLDLFEKVLNSELNKLKEGKRIDEKLMHNLIFQQTSENPEISDLWLINEDFIYFKGSSEIEFSKLVINNKKLFNDKFKNEEQKYLNSLGEKRLEKRPDILLFPEEGKCIIIELKAPDVNVATHISQSDFYANLIRNYTTSDFEINIFYSYLIGEAIEDRDVRGHVSDFKHAYHLDYWFRPKKDIVCFDDRKDGDIYTEIIKYSSLLKRAQLRNKIFIEKLTNK